MTAEAKSANGQPSETAAEVVYLFNGMPVPTPGTVSENLVEWLEGMLERARSGEIIGMVAAYEYPSREGAARISSYSVVGYVDTYAIIGALECAKHQMVMRVVAE